MDNLEQVLLNELRKHEDAVYELVKKSTATRPFLKTLSASMSLKEGLGCLKRVQLMIFYL